MSKATAKMGRGEPKPHLLSDADVEQMVTSIYERYNSGLIRFLNRRLKTKEDVDDVSQEVYLRLIRYRPARDLKPSLSLLFSIASNLLKDRFRRQKAHKKGEHVPIETVDITSPELSAEELIQSRESLKIYEKAIKGLNRKSRRAFVLNRFKGLTYEQVALKMGISRSMVQKHISQVLTHLRKEFETYL